MISKLSLTSYYKLVVIWLLLFTSLSTVAAQTKTWTGSFNNNWANANNWSPAGIPTATNDVIIISGANVNITGTYVANAKSVSSSGGLSIASGATLNILQSTGIGYENKHKLTNLGTLNIAQVGGMGLVNNGTDGTTKSFINEGTVIIDGASRGINNLTSTNNKATGSITIIHTSGDGIYNDSLFTNWGNIEIDDTGANGILNLASFMVRASGTVSIGSNAGADNISQNGILNTSMGSFRNEGSVSIENVGTSGIINSSSGSTFTNTSTGTIRIGTNGGANNISANGIYNFSSASFSNEGSVSIENVGTYGIINSSFSYINDGTITIDITGADGIFNSSFNASFTNTSNGTILIGTNGGANNISDNGISNSSSASFSNEGSVSIENVGISGIINSSSGTLFTNTSTGTIRIGTNGGANNISDYGIVNSSSASFSNEGSVSIENVGTYGIINSSFSYIINDGTITIDITGADGIINTSSNASFTNTSNGTILIGTTGGINNISGNGIRNYSSFSNAGSISTYNSGIHGIVNHSYLSNEGSISIDNTIGSDVRNAITAVLIGSGTYSLSDSLSTESILSPGTSPGTIQITGDLIHTATAIDTFELAGTMGGGHAMGHDSIYIDGDLTLEGKLVIKLLDGFTPATTDEFVLMEYTGALTGTFATVELPSPEMDGWEIDYSTVGKIALRNSPCGMVRWSGAHSQSWNIAENWYEMRVPTACDSVSISNAIDTVYINQFAHAAGIFINNSILVNLAGLTIEGPEPLLFGAGLRNGGTYINRAPLTITNISGGHGIGNQSGAKFINWDHVTVSNTEFNGILNRGEFLNENRMIITECQLGITNFSGVINNNGVLEIWESNIYDIQNSGNFFNGPDGRIKLGFLGPFDHVQTYGWVNSNSGVFANEGYIIIDDRPTFGGLQIDKGTEVEVTGDLQVGQSSGS